MERRQRAQEIKNRYTSLYPPTTSLQAVNVDVANPMTKPRTDIIKVKQQNLKSMLNKQIQEFGKKQMLKEHLTQFPLQRTPAAALSIDPRQQQINAIDKISEVMKTKLLQKQYQKKKETAKRDNASRVIGRFYRNSLEARGIYL